jgi:Protein of unknown function (DUF3533)
VAANHAPKPHHVPVGIVGTPGTSAATAGPLALRAPGAFQFRTYSSLATARTGVLDRAVYGAYRPGSPAVLLIASAASPTVAPLLQRTFAATATAQGRTLAVSDLAPLPSSDSRGATAFSAVLSLIIAGVMGSAVIYLLGRHLPIRVRLAAMCILGIGAGLVTALLTNVIVGAFHGHFMAIWGVATLFVLSLALPIAAFQVLVGAGGSAIGAVAFLVIGNPASGGSSAPELLPGFWRDLSQLLPPGAATTAMRDVVYFHAHGATRALLVLAAYAILGISLALTVDIVRARERPVTAAA